MNTSVMTIIKHKRISFPAILLFVLNFAFAQQTTISLNAGEAKFTINKNIYGHFAEHLGHCIYDGFYVGDTNKTIPNTDGVRNDIIAALKKLKVPVLRWPGGCFADTYHWKDGIGPKDKRPTMINNWWGGVTEDNSLDRKSTRLNSSHIQKSRMPSSA